MQANKSLNRSGGWARNLNLKVAGRRPVSFGVELNRFARGESFGVVVVSGVLRGLFVTILQVVRACQVAASLQVVRALTLW